MNWIKTADQLPEENSVVWGYPDYRPLSYSDSNGQGWEFRVWNSTCEDEGSVVEPPTHYIPVPTPPED